MYIIPQRRQHKPSLNLICSSSQPNLQCRNPNCRHNATCWNWFSVVSLAFPTCSWAFLQEVKDHHMQERNLYEEKAVVHAGVAAGEYVERVGRTDMATWSEDEWNGFVSFVCAEYVNGLLVQCEQIEQAVAQVAVPG